MTTSTDTPTPDLASETSNSFFEWLSSAVNWRLLLGASALFALFVALFAVIQYGSPALVGTDGYYHARMGWLLREQGLKPAFIWMPNTILGETTYYDHHLLYHLYLALFGGAEPATDGGYSLTQSAKAASIILPSLAFLVIWWLLRSQGVRWAAIWALGLFALSEAFLYRMSMPRAQAASLMVLAFGLYLLFQERYWLLLPLGSAYVWLYNGFPLLLIVAIVYVLATWLTERRFVWQALLFPAAGIALGLVANPYFPENINFIANHLLPKIGESSVRLGNEWYPYETWTLVENSGFALTALVLGVMAWGWRKERMNRVALTTFILVALFAFMVFRSRRFIEYFPAFILIFAAIAITPLVEKWQEQQGRWRKLVPLVLFLPLALATFITVSQAKQAVARSKPADQYAEAAIWLHDNSPPGSLVFQTDWDDFTRLFFYNLNNIYTIGLDPTYLELYNAERYGQWKSITRGEVEQPGELIRGDFKAGYVFSDLKHEEFLEVASNDPFLEEVYRDEYGVIFLVLE